MNKPKAGDSLPSCKKERERGHTSNIVLFQTCLAVCMAAFHCVRHSVREGRREQPSMPTDNKWAAVSRERSAAPACACLPHLRIALPCLFGLPCQRPSFSLPFSHRPTTTSGLREAGGQRRRRRQSRQKSATLRGGRGSGGEGGAIAAIINESEWASKQKLSLVGQSGLP